MSVPAEMELAEMLVPSWARQKTAAIKKTPVLAPAEPWFKKELSTSRGDQRVSPTMMVEAEDTMIPMKEVREKARGMVMAWDQTADFLVLEKRVKSGSLTIRVAKLAIQFIKDLTNSQPNSEPWMVLGWCTIGPIPPARLTVQIKKPMPAIGTR